MKCGLVAPKPRPRARGCGARPTRRCRILTGAQASPIIRETACSSIGARSAAAASGTTCPVLPRGSTSARLPVLCRPVRPRRRRHHPHPRRRRPRLRRRRPRPRRHHHRPCSLRAYPPASPTTQAAARTAWSSISAAPASGTTSPVPLRGDTSARLPVLCRRRRPARRRPRPARRRRRPARRRHLRRRRRHRRPRPRALTR